MTGKDEWRLVHIQNGMLTDSLTNKQPKPGDANQKQADSTAGQYVGEQAGLGVVQQQGGQGNNPALRRRPSDNAAGNISMPGAQPVGPDGQPLQPGMTATNTEGSPVQPPALLQNQPGTIPTGFLGQVGPGGMPGQLNPAIPGVIPGTTGAVPGGATPDSSNQSYVGGGYSTGGTTATPIVPSQPVQPQMPFPGQNPQFPGQAMFPGQAGFPGQQAIFPAAPGAPVNSAAGGVSPTYAATPGANAQTGGYNTPGVNPDAQNAAAAMIGNLLRQPRPTGMPTGGDAGAGAVIGGGIAGVASKADADSIMVYADHENYKEWEFIYDPMKDRPPPNPLTGAGIPAAQIGNTAGQGNTGTPASQLGTAPGSPTPAGSGASPFGNSSQPVTSFGRQ